MTKINEKKKFLVFSNLLYKFGKINSYLKEYNVNLLI